MKRACTSDFKQVFVCFQQTFFFIKEKDCKMKKCNFTPGYFSKCRKFLSHSLNGCLSTRLRFLCVTCSTLISAPQILFSHINDLCQIRKRSYLSAGEHREWRNEELVFRFYFKRTDLEGIVQKGITNFQPCKIFIPIKDIPLILSQ